jgi:hypothetical protein
MSIKDKINQKIECCNRLTDNLGNNYCKFLSNKLGRPQIVGKTFCNLKCRDSGPYDGKTLTIQEERDFVVGSLSRVNPAFIMDKKFIGKIISKYSLPVDIIIPDEYEMIMDHLKIVNDFKGFKKMYFTGSCVTSNAPRPLKDIDVLLWFDTMEDYILTDIKSKLPKNINDIKMDYFFGSGDVENLSSIFFCHISVEDKKFYVSKWFKPNLKSLPEGFQIVEAKYAEYEDAMRKLYDTMDAPSPNKQCCGKT